MFGTQPAEDLFPRTHNTNFRPKWSHHDHATTLSDIEAENSLKQD
jgi:hypothetical protein